MEQSRNTLYFAARAKEVTNNAKVNMVRRLNYCGVDIVGLTFYLFFSQLISDKQLVKQLQKEVARLEAELRTPDPSGSTDAVLVEKELQIKKVTLIFI